MGTSKENSPHAQYRRVQTREVISSRIPRSVMDVS
jgi:hypothetical protein